MWQANNRRWATPQHYSCSYMAMFPPTLPHYFIRRFTTVGDTVLDPFSGRGTTALEAIAQNRIGIGNDLNDLAYVLTKGKLANPSIEEVLQRIDNLEKDYTHEEWKWPKGPHKIKMIFHPNTLSQLNYLKKEIDWKNEDVDAFLAMVLMGAMHGQSSGFLSLSMPNTFSMGWNYVKKYKQKNNLKRPKRDVFEVIRHRCKRLLKNGKLPGYGFAIHGDVRDLGDCKQIAESSVKMIFSSPPYLKVIKYGLYNWIRLWWLIDNHKSIDEKLDDEHSIKPYLEFMRDVLETTLPLLNQKSGIACWVIGDVKDTNLAKLVWDEAASKIETINENGEIQRYRLLGIITDEIKAEEKVTKIWNSESDKSGKATLIDRILIICNEKSNPKSYLKNDQINWNPTEDAAEALI
ncbi:MAG: DNA methyltransferase [Candidatus Thermoplasmatota archaeon]|nr:DNA methyltransferase [Candidatus Thermoplasmatota archaeon]